MKWLDAEEEFKSWFTSKRNFCFQFLDARKARGEGGSDRIFVGAQPSDFLVTDNGLTFYAEVKSCQDPVSFPFGSIRKSQWSAAIQVTAAKGAYHFFLKNEVEQQWYQVPARILIEIRDAGGRSVKWENLKEYKR